MPLTTIKATGKEKQQKNATITQQINDNAPNYRQDSMLSYSK
jgi:hypothetical protein